MDCSICGKEYKSWRGVFYHKRKVHNCEDVLSSRYEYEIKSAAKIAEEKVRQFLFRHRRLRKATVGRHYLEKHKENFTWMKCKLCCREHREEILKDHIRGHNVYIRDELLTTEHHDAILVALEELAEDRREFMGSR